MSDKISIVIINKNEKSIANTLTALRPYSSNKKAEIIVVDASSKKLDYIYDTFPWIKKYNFTPSSSTRKSSIPEQRNYGIRHSSGDILVFLDSGCIPSENWLHELTDPILHEGEFVVTGPTLSENKTTKHDNVAIRNKKFKYLTETGTGNLAFRREVFDTVKGFDETFHYGSDVDFSWRVIEAGYKVRNQPSAIVSHDWGSFQDEVRRSFKYGRARMHLFIKHKTKKDNIYKRNIGIIAYPLYVLLLPVTFIIPWYPALILIPFLKNIKLHPFMAIVDHIVYGFGAFYELFLFYNRKAQRS